MRPRVPVLVGGLVAVAAGALVLDAGRSSGTSAGDVAGPPARQTVAVTTRDLVEREELDGTLGYGERRDVGLAAQGTITALAPEGSVVDRGGVLAEVDGREVRLLFGTRPPWRALGPSVSDGPDVRQVEENLVALGHATSADLTVDDDWTSATTAAVKRWQEANGEERSGTIEPGDVVVLPGAVRIAEHTLSPGSPATSGPALAVTGTEKVVTVDLEAARRELLTVGSVVDVELPDGTTLAGTVWSVSSVVSPPADESEGGDPTVAVVVALAGGTETTFDSSPVEVVVTSEEAAGVLTVPVDALLAVAEGGYAVERVRDGGTQLVGVETGAFADGHVQVTGDLADGDEVVVPR